MQYLTIYYKGVKYIMTQNESNIIKNAVLDATEAYVEAKLSMSDFVKTQIGIVESYVERNKKYYHVVKCDNGRVTYNNVLSVGNIPFPANSTVFLIAPNAQFSNQFILGNMMDFYKAKSESYGKVKIACQYKYSSAEDMQKYWFDMLNEKLPDETVKAIKDMELQTVRFVVDNTVQAPDENVLLNHEYIYGPKNNYVANVDSLTNFINWATKACPAKHYILIVSDHGGGYQPHDDLPFNAPSQTRGVLYDQSHTPNEHFTASSLKYAIGRANAHMDVIYLDACLMNTIEYQFELKELANYFILSSFTVPGAGGSYSVLIDELAKNTGDIETALKNFNKSSVDKWYKDAAKQAAQGSTESKWDYHDMTVTRTSALEAFGAKFKEFTDKLVAAYADESHKAKIDTITKYAFKVNNERPGYDLVDYAKSIVDALPDVYDDHFALEIYNNKNTVPNKFDNSYNYQKQKIFYLILLLFVFLFLKMYFSILL